MALISPGVEVTVIDESFYTPAEPGTTPLIVVATAQDKTNGAGTGTAAATTKANAGRAFRITSQRELTELYGVPFFEKTATANPIHGGERNEYGLLAAYSLLGVTNSVFITRADVDLDELAPQTTAPGSEPVDGAWWFDTRNTSWGIQEWNGRSALTAGGQRFTNKVPTVLFSGDTTKVENNAPKATLGTSGDYAVVVQSDKTVKYFYRRNTALLSGDPWVEIGTPDWVASHPTVQSAAAASFTAVIGNSYVMFINGTPVNVNVSSTTTLNSVVGAINGLSITGVTAYNNNNRLELYTNGANDGAGPDPLGLPGDSVLSNSITISGDAALLTALSIQAGTFYGPALQQSPHTVVPQWKSTTAVPRPTGSVWVKTTEPNFGARWRVKRWSSGTKTWVEFSAPIYESTHAALFFLDRANGGLGIGRDELFIQSNSTENVNFDNDPASAQFTIFKRSTAERTQITSTAIGSGTIPAGAKTFTMRESVKGSASLSAPITISFTAASNSDDAELMATEINNVGFTNIEAQVTANNELVLIHRTGGDIRITEVSGSSISSIFEAYDVSTNEGTPGFFIAPIGAQSTQVGYPGSADVYLVTNWVPLAAGDSFAAQDSQPLEEPVDGQLWYNPSLTEVDIMVHDGNTWVGYRTATSPYCKVDDNQKTDPNGPIVAASKPTVQSDATPLVTGDLWISTADLENFPTIYRYDADLRPADRWVLIDKTDQTTEDGVVFGDARYGTSGSTGNTAASIRDLLSNNYLDPDAPDPALYPKGIMLWNTRRSSGNVKRYANEYINQSLDNLRFDPQNIGGESMNAYATDRWVTASPNQEDGSGTFGRKAQRGVVVAAMKSAVDTSSEIRDEERRNFNIIAAPGYPELLSNLINLNIDRGLTAFVVGDTPLRLSADATSLTAWGTNANGALDNGDKGIVSFDEYSAVYYPNGFTTDLGGSNAVVPASHMMLRTIALSDSVSYPWFAPAGTRRGGITNATAVGYIDSLTGEFQSVALNEGQRDTLYDLKVNPIPFFVGVGLVAYGQKTRARNASALDRINVARLVVYLRSQLNRLARPYLFEPNDKITRDEIKGAVESLLLELVGLRALFDFAVVCDESNNTPARVDRNELWVDIAIEPVKAVEFIYIPLRIKNTGEI